MMNFRSKMIAAVAAFGLTAAALPSVFVPQYGSETFTLSSAIEPVKPICKMNLRAVAKGDKTFLQRYIMTRKNDITLAEAQRVFDACTLYGMGAAEFITMMEEAEGTRI